MIAQLHAEHGKSSSGEDPDDPDCICRDTKLQKSCASMGCGFCKAAEMLYGDWKAKE
jgi:hypothetical protein